MNPTSIVKTLGGKAYVYAPYVLLRSLEVWKGRERIAIPSQIRSLIEATYEERDSEPEAWQKLFDEWFATDSGKKFFADLNSNLWTVALEDDEGVQTRLNEVPTLSLVLCRRLSKTAAEFIDASSAVLGGEEFRLATAQAIHRNLVKVPTRHFAQTKEHPAIARYLRGAQSIGLVDHDGTVNVEGLQNDVRLLWSSELGIIIDTASVKGDK
jgi:CRISPR-associated endonuclease/helicase Cas3